MAAAITLNFRRSLGNKIFIVTAFLFFTAVFLFCSFYIFSGYDSLVKWYIGLNDCFYKKETWANDFFTPHVKESGNVYCIIALLLSVAGTGFILKRIKKTSWQLRQDLIIRIGAWDVLCAGICLAVITGFWLWGWPQALPSSDEIFSASNCAGIHPFQTISYYMLPNNHIFFNLLNNILFHSFSNKGISKNYLFFLNKFYE